MKGCVFPPRESKELIEDSPEAIKNYQDAQETLTAPCFESVAPSGS